MLSARGMLKARHAWHGTLGTARIARQIVRQTADAVGNADSNAKKLHGAIRGHAEMYLFQAGKHMYMMTLMSSYIRAPAPCTTAVPPVTGTHTLRTRINGCGRGALGIASGIPSHIESSCRLGDVEAPPEGGMIIIPSHGHTAHTEHKRCLSHTAHSAAQLSDGAGTEALPPPRLGPASGRWQPT